MLAYGNPTDTGFNASALVVMVDGLDVTKALSVLGKQINTLLACE